MTKTQQSGEGNSQPKSIYSKLLQKDGSLCSGKKGMYAIFICPAFNTNYCHSELLMMNTKKILISFGQFATFRQSFRKLAKRKKN